MPTRSGQGWPAPRSRKKEEVEKNLPPLRPAIVGAFYGAYNDWLEVTDKVRTLAFQSKALKAAVKADAGELGVPNHDDHQAKTPVIVYLVGGQACLSLTQEGGTAAPPAPPGEADAEAARLGPGQELLVLAARYGATAQAHHMVNGWSLAVRSDSLSVDDPAPGKHKALLVVYRHGNKVRFSVSPQEETTALGAVPPKP